MHSTGSKKKFIPLPADVDVGSNSKDNFDKIAFFHASQQRADTPRLIARLLAAEADPDSRDDNGRTPLSYAAERREARAVKLLLTSQQVDPDSRDDLGRTPLSYAAAQGVATAVKLLLTSEQVDPDSRDDLGRTPLSYAAKRGNYNTVKLLITTGCVDPSLEDHEGRTALSWAKEWDRGYLMPLLQVSTSTTDVDGETRTYDKEVMGSRVNGSSRDLVEAVLVRERRDSGWNKHDLPEKGNKVIT